MSILDKLVDEKKTKFKSIKVRVTEETSVKIKFICNVTGIKEDEYLGKIIEESEINKVYKSLQKENEKESF